MVACAIRMVILNPFASCIECAACNREYQQQTARLQHSCIAVAPSDGYTGRPMLAVVYTACQISSSLSSQYQVEKARFFSTVCRLHSLYAVEVVAGAAGDGDSLRLMQLVEVAANAFPTAEILYHVLRPAASPQTAAGGSDYAALLTACGAGSAEDWACSMSDVLTPRPWSGVHQEAVSKQETCGNLPVLHGDLRLHIFSFASHALVAHLSVNGQLFCHRLISCCSGQQVLRGHRHSVLSLTAF